MDNNDVFKKIKDIENNVLKTIRFLQDSKKEVVLYGAGYCGYETYKLLHKHKINVVAICDDDKARVGKSFFNLKINQVSDIVLKSNTIILITSGFNAGMKQKLRNAGLYDYYYEIDFGRFEQKKETWRYFFDNKGKFDLAYKLFNDDFSRRLFINLINYRISRDLKYLKGYESENQYFPNDGIVKTGENEIFLDCGAFDGDSIKTFLDYVGGKYEKIIAMEPSDNNYKKLINSIGFLQNIEFHNKGVYKEEKKLRFSVGDAKNSFVSDSGTEELDVIDIDTLLNGEKVTFIKMDIEGAEYDALQGARSTIKKYTPKLAISIYHKTEDLLDIPLLIHEINPNYNFHLRHYSPTVIETVLYAIPREKNS